MGERPLKQYNSKIVNLIETTLHDQTGHSYTYVQCLLKANADFNLQFRLWIDRRGKKLFTNPANCTIKPYFYRPLRQLQKISLYYKLLRQEGTIFVGTTELWDLRILAWLAAHIKVKAQVILHFHQFNQKPNKLATLDKIAKQNTGFKIIAPTQKLADIFIKHGFNDCQAIAFPTYHPIPTPDNITAKFSKVLYAGAARSDKGFASVVDAIEYNRNCGHKTIFEIQTSPPNSLRYDAETQQALTKLYAIAPENLILNKHTLNAQQYLQQFQNAICLLIYKQQDYQDKFSGIALDAFYAGSPIITAKNTWMGNMAEKYQAGIALSNYAPEAVQAAIEQIAENYVTFHANAKQAAQDLAAKHDPRHTLEFITS